ncbi:MAG: hydroxyacylglutathione hydrolase [Myxococcales bacterium]|nr:hydroxyacylglutathione hydrolase [Myxococcales bacterium]MCB9583072.1 hydroxyacylglutathione hydrolase [Polyangiaceae bacterium]
MQITPISCLRDNFAYLIHADGSDRALVVDPSEAAPVIAALEAAGLTLVGILSTHHHWDHVGGNEELCARFDDLEVYGHASDADGGRIPGQTHRLEHEQTFEAAGLAFRALHIPGHTTGAVAYLVEDAVFTGDTLFAAGCGRLFEGTPAMMYASLNEKLGALPDATRVYFGHEYTENNLRFAAHVEPSNADVKAKAERAAALRARGEPTTPSTIGEERLTNPFMRCDSAEIRHSVKLDATATPVDVLAAVRSAKDAF